MARAPVRAPQTEDQEPQAEAQEGEAPEAAAEGGDSPVLDLTDAAVKRMIKLAKKRGYVTYDELNEVLPQEEFTSEQIEDVLGQLSELGVNVVEAEEADRIPTGIDELDRLRLRSLVLLPLRANGAEIGLLAGSSRKWFL